jgi:hypothetical protein
MKSKKSSTFLDLDRDLPTSAEDILALRRVRREKYRFNVAKMDDEVYPKHWFSSYARSEVNNDKGHKIRIIDWRFNDERRHSSCAG